MSKEWCSPPRESNPRVNITNSAQIATPCEPFLHIYCAKYFTQKYKSSFLKYGSLWIKQFKHIAMPLCLNRDRLVFRILNFFKNRKVLE